MQVLKQFNTRRGRFTKGQPVVDDEDFSPHRRETLIAGGYLGDPPTAKRAKAERPPVADKDSLDKKGTGQ